MVLLKDDSVAFTGTVSNEIVLKQMYFVGLLGEDVSRLHVWLKPRWLSTTNQNPGRSFNSKFKFTENLQ